MSKGLIILDPGHGKTGNPHTTKAGYYEGTQNFVLSQYLRDELVARGFDVKVTRETVDDNPELAERGSMAGRLGAKMFLSLHSNAPGASRSPEEYARVRGAETYYSVTDEEGNAPIARALNDAVVRTMGTLDRGIKTRRHPDELLCRYPQRRAVGLPPCVSYRARLPHEPRGFRLPAKR